MPEPLQRKRKDHADPAGGRPDSPVTPNTLPDSAKDVEEALAIMRKAHDEKRALQEAEEVRLTAILCNLGVAREHLANMVKRLAQSSPERASWPERGV